MADKSPHLFFSGESENAKNLGKFSYIPFSPTQIWEISEESKKKDWKEMQDIFQKIQKNGKTEISGKNWNFPFMGGLAGVFPYDFMRTFKDIPLNQNMSQHFPFGLIGLYEIFFVFDHEEKKLELAGWFENHEKAENFFEQWQKRIVSEKFSEISQKSVKLSHQFFPEISQKEYQEKFKICQKEIEKGNSFQINFSQKFLAQTNASAWDVFLASTHQNPAPMMYFSEHKKYSSKEISIVSCSPERLFSCDKNRKIFTQPIAGTRPRGTTEKEEKFLENELTNSQKELSEHSMIVDLLRNDFGKVSAFGSVKVTDFMRVEKYATVMHLVTDIVGEISPEKTVFDVFESLFPGGTITGTPKTETMKILAREEISSRNFYCGSAGFFSFCGSADWNILIRTLEKNGTEISGRAGGGLVWGANPEHEYQETLHKFSGIKKIFT